MGGRDGGSGKLREKYRGRGCVSWMDGGLGREGEYDEGVNDWPVLVKSVLILGSDLEMYEETIWGWMCLEESCTTNFSVFNVAYVLTAWAWLQIGYNVFSMDFIPLTPHRMDELIIFVFRLLDRKTMQRPIVLSMNASDDETKSPALCRYL